MPVNESKKESRNNGVPPMSLIAPLTARGLESIMNSFFPISIFPLSAHGR